MKRLSILLSLAALVLAGFFGQTSDASAIEQILEENGGQFNIQGEGWPDEILPGNGNYTMTQDRNGNWTADDNRTRKVEKEPYDAVYDRNGRVVKWVKPKPKPKPKPIL